MRWTRSRSRPARLDAPEPVRQLEVEFLERLLPQLVPDALLLLLPREPLLFRLGDLPRLPPALNHRPSVPRSSFSVVERGRSHLRAEQLALNLHRRLVRVVLNVRRREVRQKFGLVALKRKMPDQVCRVGSQVAQDGLSALVVLLEGVVLDDDFRHDLVEEVGAEVRRGGVVVNAEDGRAGDHRAELGLCLGRRADKSAGSFRSANRGERRNERNTGTHLASNNASSFFASSTPSLLSSGEAVKPRMRGRWLTGARW